MKLVYGKGVNDSTYKVASHKDGKQKVCHFYTVWRLMIYRSYSPDYHAKKPTYADCSVFDEWLSSFMSFRGWMLNQPWEGRFLDKDILEIGNKEYHPEKCVFIGADLNSFFTDHAARRGNCAQGVIWNKRHKKYTAHISWRGKRLGLGYYNEEGEAEKAYLKEKIALSNILSNKYKSEDERIARGIQDRVSIMKERISQL